MQQLHSKELLVYDAQGNMQEAFIPQNLVTGDVIALPDGNRFTFEGGSGSGRSSIAMEAKAGNKVYSLRVTIIPLQQGARGKKGVLILPIHSEGLFQNKSHINRLIYGQKALTELGVPLPRLYAAHKLQYLFMENKKRDFSLSQFLYRKSELSLSEGMKAGIHQNLISFFVKMASFSQIKGVDFDNIYYDGEKQEWFLSKWSDEFGLFSSRLISEEYFLDSLILMKKNQKSNVVEMTAPKINGDLREEISQKIIEVRSKVAREETEALRGLFYSPHIASNKNARYLLEYLKKARPYFSVEFYDAIFKIFGRKIGPLLTTIPMDDLKEVLSLIKVESKMGQEFFKSFLSQVSSFDEFFIFLEQHGHLGHLYEEEIINFVESRFDLFFDGFPTNEQARIVLDGGFLSRAQEYALRNKWGVVRSRGDCAAAARAFGYIDKTL